jgi:hypothetical protein
MRGSIFSLIAVLTGLAAAGCGTTKWSDTPRTATEQLLISTAVDRAIDGMDFKPLTGKDVFLDTVFLEGITDKNYVISSLRQHMLAQGVVLAPSREHATYVVEARAGVVGTNHHDVLVGIPALSLPGSNLVPGAPSAIPEIPFAKTTEQKGIAKIAAFAYNQKTGQPIWQSGVFPIVANAKDTWILGTGPFQRGSIYDGTRFAGSRFLFGRRNRSTPEPKPEIPLTAEAVFDERPELVKKEFPILPSKPVAPAPPSAAPAAPAGGAIAGAAPGGAANSPGQPVSPAANSMSGAKDGLPPGRVVRLPPLEQVVRPDLQQKLESTDSSSGEAKSASGGSSSSFNLFKLR